jgi:hypothetical protein
MASLFLRHESMPPSADGPIEPRQVSRAGASWWAADGAARPAFGHGSVSSSSTSSSPACYRGCHIGTLAQSLLSPYSSAGSWRLRASVTASRAIQTSDGFRAEFHHSSSLAVNIGFVVAIVLIIFADSRAASGLSVL